MVNKYLDFNLIKFNFKLQELYSYHLFILQKYSREKNDFLRNLADKSISPHDRKSLIYWILEVSSRLDAILEILLNFNLKNKFKKL